MAGAARKEQEKLPAKLATATALPAMNDDNPTVSAANGERRQEGGGPRYVPRRPPASISAAGEGGGQRYVPRRSDDHDHQEGLTT
ncbi:hypothetical protein [Mycobacterium avium]|uniref:hypothetical protein n=1 Tax=Mycobacterium avium TaxID=1764 RepID=UPI0011316288|nr:hypothetical protein [Mycobacterium avium]MDV3291914.1 hypothetical protein [Mycobacterium avium subsp. hominissuis]